MSPARLLIAGLGNIKTIGGAKFTSDLAKLDGRKYKCERCSHGSVFFPSFRQHLKVSASNFNWTVQYSDFSTYKKGLNQKGVGVGLSLVRGTFLSVYKVTEIK